MRGAHWKEIQQAFEEFGRRFTAEEDETNCGSQLVELLPELEYSGINLAVTLFGTAEPIKNYQIQFSVHSESKTDQYVFGVTPEHST